MTDTHPEPLPTWERPHFEPGGGDAFLFFAVFGRFAELPAMSRSQYQSDGPPSELNVSSYSRMKDPAVWKTLCDGPVWDGFIRDNPVLASIAHDAPACIVLSGDITDPPTLNYLRDSIGFLQFLLDHGGECIYDPQMFRWWTPQDWRTDIVAPTEPALQRQVVILTSEEPDSPESTLWYHTRGMRKFGRPDLSMPGVRPEVVEAVIEMMNRFISMQALGAVIPEGESIRMKGLPEDLRCRHRGTLEDPDFNNVHVEITAE